MKVAKVAMAGTLESSDIMIKIEPAEAEGIEFVMQSPVEQQYGRQIKKVIMDMAEELGLTNVRIHAVDKGAMDCTIRARFAAAITRASDGDQYNWNRGVK